jgi:hypothetical protein
MLIPFGTLAASGALFASDFELITSTTIPSDQTSITISNLQTFSSEYKHLQLRIDAKSTRTAGSDDLTIRLNSDFGANYSCHILLGYNGGNLAYGFGNGSMFVSPAARANTSTSAVGAFVDFLDAYSSKHKTFRSFSGEAGQLCLGSGSWNNTAPISTIQLVPVYVSTIAAGSRVSVYGIRG